MRLIAGLLIALFVSLAQASDMEDAVEYYEDAKEAYSENDLEEARLLLLKALKIHSVDNQVGLSGNTDCRRKSSSRDETCIPAQSLNQQEYMPNALLIKVLERMAETKAQEIQKNHQAR